MRTYARFSARPTISNYATWKVCFIGRLTYVLYVLITMSITWIFFPEMNINPPSMQSSCVPKLCNWHSSTRVNDRSVPCPLCRRRILPNQVAYDNNLQTRADHFRITLGLGLRQKPRPSNVTTYWRRQRRFAAVRIQGLIIYVSRSGLQLWTDWPPAVVAEIVLNFVATVCFILIFKLRSQ